ncbi:MAG: hypothetical protein Ct9H90mP2_07360 [Dehalococcoidia bacterium]|nr:MAG: hypothetical protein Ct9H90mP2_07360 [Dehalococcoidia bacterium]
MIEKPKLTMRLFISLVVAGALGNIIDRLGLDTLMTLLM